MNPKIQAAKNVISSWLSLAVTAAVGFFLFPFILHRLGDEAFGLWSLINSLTGFYWIFDLGIQSSIIRYVARFAATDDQDQMARLLSTSLFFYSVVGVVLLVITGGVSWFVGALFHIPADSLTTARLLVLMVGSALALGFPLSVFAGAVIGLQKIYWEGLTQIASTLLRALLIIIVLKRGGGLLSVAFVMVGVPLVNYLVFYVLVNRAMPMQLGWRFIDRALFRKMTSFGSSTLLIGVGDQLRFKSDAIVIGVFLSSSAITAFSIASRLLEYPIRIIQSMAQIFTPMSSQLDASGDYDRLRRIFVQGNRFCALTMWPVSAILIVLGKSIIEVWVGAKYVSVYPVLVILLIPVTVYYSQATSNRILFGMNRHRPLAIVALIDGVANLILSAALVRPWGIVGDAVGTAVPLLASSLFFLPAYLCRQLNIRLGTFLRQAYLIPLVLCTPLILVLLGLRRLFYARTYAQLLAQLTAGGLVYGIGLLWLFLTKEPIGVRLRTRFVALLEGALDR